MDWDKLKTFHSVAQAGSFTLAAKRLNLSQSALSRQIKSLEDSLNLSLFTRHARGLVLTEEGKQLYNTAEDVVKKIDHTRQELLDSKKKPFGKLKVTTTHAFGSYWLSRNIKEFVYDFPDIELELVLSDEALDLAKGQADVAIRFQTPTHADLIVRPLITVHHHIYASPTYIEKCGVPQTIEDLKHHNLIAFGTTISPPIKEFDWLLSTGIPKLKPVVEISSLFGILSALKSGIGIASIPDYLAKSSPELVRILGEVESPSFKSYFVYPREMKRSKRVSVFKDFIIKKILAAAGTF